MTRFNFAQLVQRDDIKRYISRYDKVGGRGVEIADLDYFEPTVIKRSVAETVVTVPLAPATIRVAIGGAVRAPRSYRRGLFDVTPAQDSYVSEREDAGANLAIALPGAAIDDALRDIAPSFSNDFGPLHEEPHESTVILALAERLTEELSSPSAMGALYADELARMLIVELYHCAKLAPLLTPPPALSDHALRKIDDYIDAHAMASVGLSELADLVRMSQSQFCKAFKEKTGKTPYQHALRRRVMKARDLVQNSRAPLAQIAYDCGFSSQAHMTSVFRKKLGVTPGRLRHR